VLVLAGEQKPVQNMDIRKKAVMRMEAVNKEPL
jgi:hypothetical protein